MNFSNGSPFFDFDDGTITVGGVTIGLPGEWEEPEQDEYYDTPAPPTSSSSSSAMQPVLIGAALLAAFYLFRR